MMAADNGRRVGTMIALGARAQSRRRAGWLLAWSIWPSFAVADEECTDLLVRMQRINVGAGVYTEQAVAAAPIEIDIPIAIDTQRYGECLERAGLDRSDAVAAWVERSAQCRRKQASPVRIGPATNAPRIGGAHDEDSYRACLDSTFDVEVELPE